jgi:hypothetical protein
LTSAYGTTNRDTTSFLWVFWSICPIFDTLTMTRQSPDLPDTPGCGFGRNLTRKLACCSTSAPHLPSSATTSTTRERQRYGQTPIRNNPYRSGMPGETWPTYLEAVCQKRELARSTLSCGSAREGDRTCEAARSRRMLVEAIRGDPPLTAKTRVLTKVNPFRPR